MGFLVVVVSPKKKQKKRNETVALWSSTCGDLLLRYGTCRPQFPFGRRRDSKVIP